MSDINVQLNKYDVLTNNVVTEIYHGTLWLTLNRPQQRNAMDCALLDSLLSCLHIARNDNDVRCIVITGEGKGFCSGADVGEWAEVEARGELSTYAWNAKAHAVMLELQSTPKPTIAAINGTVVGGGLDLALSCDFRYSVPTAKFLAGYTKMAFSPDAGSSWHLPRLIGLESAKDFLFFDQPWTANKALVKGMVTEILDTENFYDLVSDKADLLAKGPLVAIAETKRLLTESFFNTFEQQLHEENESSLLCGETADAKEAIQAATERRDPQFIGA